VDSAKLNDWLQVIGLFGVIASLIFVGLQMKQAQEIAMSAAYQARADASSALWSENAANPVLIAAAVKSRRGGYDQLSEEEKEALRYDAQAWLIIFENVHYQYVNGFIPEEHWIRVREAYKSDFRTQEYRLLYERNPNIWRESFRAILAEMIEEVEAETASAPP
jgi:hypothetical protein